MAEADVTVTVKTVDQGSTKMQAFAKQVHGVNDSIKASQKTWQNYTFAIGAAVGVMAGATFAAKKLYDSVRAGAVLETTTQRFDKLSASIGTTADALLRDLRTATQGMTDDMTLMAAASELMGLKLTKNHDQTVRLAAVAGQLGWNMQFLIMEMNNMTGLRLDTLGLALDEVKAKAKEFEATGMSAKAAWAEAIITLGEAKLEIGGVAESEKQFRQLEAAIVDVRNELLQAATEGATSSGFTAWLGELAKTIQLNRQLEAAYRDGRISVEQYGIALDIAATEGKSAADGLAYLDRALETNTGALYDQEAQWRAWAISVQVNADESARAVVAASTEIFRSLVGIQSGLDWMGGAVGGVHQFAVSPQKRTNRMAVWAQQSTDRYRAADEERRALLQAENAVTSYGGAIAGLTQQETELAAAHERFMAAFNSELTSDPAQGLINEAGLVNVEAMNKALLEQAQAAGASATTLALLGVATGQFSEEQAEAALKAAVLQERIMQLAKGIASGEMSMGDALGNLAAFQQNIDQTGAGSLPETVAQLVDSIPADDRTVEFLSSTGLVDDDIRRLSGTNVVIPVTFQPTNDPTPTVDPGRSGPAGKNGRTAVSVDMNLNFNGPANANDVTRGVRHGMSSWAKDLQREGVF